ncbi:MAG: plasmid pRiA4b ORF-3 family protein [bacterium]|nr:plasmid pRiA4b ORF-3 family protein [bacterium]
MKKENYQNVYQFKIVLKDSKPLIWRRIQVPENYSFWDLHVAIQDSMGWEDCHLHEFRTIISRGKLSNMQHIGIPDPDGFGEILPGWKEKIEAWFSKFEKMNYTYDFGDSWEHSVIFEKILPKEKNKKYPICIDGKMACPFEDSGAIWGYYEKLEILKDPKHPEYHDIAEWIGDEDYNPEEFNPSEVIFDNSKTRLKLVK